jgi:hypothetical protein
MSEPDVKLCGSLVELDLRSCGSTSADRMKLMAAEQHMIPLLEKRGYIAEPWGYAAIPPRGAQLARDWRKTHRNAQERTGRPNRFPWLPDLYVSDPVTRMQFGLDVKVKRAPTFLNRFAQDKERWNTLAKPDAAYEYDDDGYSDNPVLNDEDSWQIPNINIELDSLWAFRMCEKPGNLPVFIACYLPILPISQTTSFHLMGMSAHDALRTFRHRTNDFRGKRETGGSGTDFVLLPICEMTPHDDWNTKLFYRSSK